VTRDEFSPLIQSLPSQPGIYKYFDSTDTIIYVGKAKNIRKRVSSYFVKKNDSYKTIKLVSEITKIEFTITHSEQDAFLLENSLIKTHQPKYNIVLKDDKSYPYIVIKKEPFPRVFLTRRLIRDGSEYLGPYTSIDQVRALLEFIKQTIPLRTCSLALTEKNIQAKKFKACLEYHIGNCKAPCVAFQSKEAYDIQIQQVRELLKGKLGNITQHYKKEMQELAENMEFEKAELIKKKLEYIKNYQSKSIIVNPNIDDVDICSIVSDEKYAFVNFMIIVQGSIVQTFTTRLEKKMDERDEEILPIALLHLRERFKSSSTEIISSHAFDFAEGITVTVPKLGDKRKLVDLSLQNALHLKQEQRRKATLMLQQKTHEDNLLLLKEVKTALNLKVTPHHIECFDNSNFQGAYPVAAMVCFKEAVPFKKEYRHFHIKTVEGINDFASMKEIVYRRYKRVLDEGLPIPQLIIIDGGKGQLSSAMESIKALGLIGKTTVVGLAKNVEEIFYPGDSESLKLPYQSEVLNLIKRIRDEVHRFGITFHRQTRSKGIIKNELEEIPGIAELTARTLLKHFKSVNNIKSASVDDLSALIGPAKAKKIADHFGRQS
jgi:excinuclease ABC subunit C